jgi:hypothetical protein
MENYKVQVKIAKDDVPSLLNHFDEGEVWKKVKRIVKEGKAAITVLERDDDYNGFDFPVEVTKINSDWDKDFKGNLFIETDLLLSDDEANEESVMGKVSEMLEKSNFEIYSYYLEGDLYQSYGYIDDQFSLDYDETKNSAEVENNEREQLDLFKKKKKK